MDNNFEIRRVETSDIQDLANLYEQVWPDVSFNKIEKASFVLKESKGVSYCAVKNGEIVGSRTSFYMPAYYGDRKLNCVQCGDSCIRKDCRRQGLFLKMNEVFLKAFFFEQPGELVYNISVDTSRIAYERLGWRYIHSLCCYRKFPHIIGTLFKAHFDIRKLKAPLILDTSVIVHSIDNKLLDLREEELLKKQTIHMKYTSEMFAWRVKSGNGIKMLAVSGIGEVVYKVFTRSNILKYVYIGEVFLYEYNKNELKKILHEFNNIIKPDCIIVYVTPSHPLREMYHKCGIHHLKKGFLNHGVRVETDEMKQICYDPNNWALSFMDIDTF